MTRLRKSFPEPCSTKCALANDNPFKIGHSPFGLA
jgi:hypothetical protein